MRRANDTKAASRHLPPGSGDVGQDEKVGPVHEVRQHDVIHPRGDRAAAEARGRAAVGVERGPTSDAVVRHSERIFPFVGELTRPSSSAFDEKYAAEARCGVLLCSIATWLCSF